MEEFKEVEPGHFSTISRNPLPHVLIERKLLQIGETYGNAAKFRTEVMAAAGWRHTSLVSFGKYPDEAASAFNRVRTALTQGDDPAAVLQALRKTE